MTKRNVDMELCTFCLDFHDQYMKGTRPDYARKAAVTHCRLCEEVMCADCEKSSHKEIEGDPLAVYGLTMCQKCITQVRRLTTRHLDYEAIVARELETFKSAIRRKIYILTQANHAAHH